MGQDNWKGGDGNWLTTGDWSTGAVPSSTDDVDLNGTRHVTITSSADVTIHSLEVDSAATLDITNLSTFDAVNGLPFGVFGFINVEDSVLEVQGGTINNSSEIEVSSINTNSDLTIDGTVALNGAGSIVLSGNGTAGIIGALGSSAAFTNDDNDIAGNGLISSLAFTNDATVETNPNDEVGTYTLQILGNAEGGDFDNENLLYADNGSTLVFGSSAVTTPVTIVNNGTIGLRSSGAVTDLEIANNVTIEGTKELGQILLEGSDPANDEIVSNGKSASLTIDYGAVEGAGTIGDANLTLTLGNTAGVVATGGDLVINTGSNVINVGDDRDGLAADPNPGQTSLLDIQSPVQNNGYVTADAGGQIKFDAAGTTNTGLIDAYGGSITFFKSVTNNNEISVEAGGTIIVDSSIIGSGDSEIEIGGDGLLDLAVGGTVTQGVYFGGPNATLELDQNTGQIGTEIYDIETSDSVDLGFLKLVSGDHPVWVQAGNEGNLEVVTGNGSIVANLVLAGYWNTQDFALSADTNGDTVVGLVSPTVHSHFKAARISDILFRNDATGDTGFYQISNGANAGWQDIGASSTAYKVVGIGDFNGDGTSDVLYRSAATGDTGFYAISNGTNAGWVDIGASSTAYSVVGVGDFTNSGTDDVLYRDNSTGDTGFYEIVNGANTGWVDIGASSTAYSVVGVGSFLGNDTDDILYRDNSTGDTGFYAVINGVNSGWHDIGASSTAYSVVGVGDFFGNGTDDILFRDNLTGDTGFYAIVNGVNTGWYDIGASSTAYSVVATGDYLATGTDDILFRDNSTGDTGFYAISNGVNTGWHDVGGSSTAYHVIG
jgi:hypothetical protein